MDAKDIIAKFEHDIDGWSKNLVNHAEMVVSTVILSSLPYMAYLLLTTTEWFASHGNVAIAVLVFLYFLQGPLTWWLERVVRGYFRSRLPAPPRTVVTADRVVHFTGGTYFFQRSGQS